jgi:hypothetical protein
MQALFERMRSLTLEVKFPAGFGANFLMCAILTANHIVKANPSLAGATAPAAETGGAISSSGFPIYARQNQTSAFLTINSLPPYIAGQSIR